MKRGFTLVELMVIVAIIGLFSAIAIMSLSGSKNKGNDAAVKQNLRALQQQAELYSLYHTNSYGTVAGNTCHAVNTVFDPANTAVVREMNAVNTANGPLGTITCGNSVGAYAVSSSLAGGKFWCVDSTGFSGVNNTDIAPGDTSC